MIPSIANRSASLAKNGLLTKRPHSSGPVSSRKTYKCAGWPAVELAMILYRGSRKPPLMRRTVLCGFENSVSRVVDIRAVMSSAAANGVHKVVNCHNDSSISRMLAF